MTASQLWTVTGLLILSLFSVVVEADRKFGVFAKTYAGSPGFPTADEWQALNASVGGRLKKFEPAGAVCYWPNFDYQKCATFRDQVQNATFISENPFLTNYPFWSGNGCPPTPWNYFLGGPPENCTQGHYPDFAIAAETAQHVSTGLKFAALHNIRVVIKNTGHDFMGRNLGAGALSIWTRHIKGFDWIEDWRPENRADKTRRQAAIRIGSGMTWAKVNYETSRRKHIVVSGIESSVGAGGGWLQGGGHGPFSVHYGLGVEHVLELEVVIPNGDIVIANDTSHPDLFWALRGGGGSTYGVITKVTYKAFPKPRFAYYWITIAPAWGPSGAEFDNYYRALSWFYTMSPRLNDFGMGGYPIASKYGYSGGFIATTHSAEEVESFIGPIADYMRRTWNVTVIHNPVLDGTLDWIMWPDYGPTKWEEAADRFWLPMVSRLWSRDAMTEKNLPAIYQFVKRTLDEGATHNPYPNMPGITKRNREWNVGLNPAWLDSCVHFLVVGTNWTTIDELQNLYSYMMETYAPMLDQFSVNHGAYINEASPFEEDWKTTFYGGGKNYERLLSVKRKYDPDNLLWCFPCVGGDVYIEGGDGKLYLDVDAIDKMPQE